MYIQLEYLSRVHANKGKFAGQLKLSLNIPILCSKNGSVITEQYVALVVA